MTGTQDIQAVVWDFDGVLNRNFQNGRFLWKARFEADLGQPLAPFQKMIFEDDFRRITTGREDLRDRVAHWAKLVGFAPGAEALLDYWFSHDNHPDPQILALLDRLRKNGVTCVIGTNNEPRRTRYIERDMGYGTRVERIFSSGLIGAAKPDQAFYDHIANALDLDPGHLLLIDDTLINVLAAQALGWQGFHLNEETRDDLTGRLQDLDLL